MTAQVAYPLASELTNRSKSSSAGCPYSASISTPLSTCPISKSSLASLIRIPAPPRQKSSVASTSTLPTLPSDAKDLLYLPPLLSLLPSQTPVTEAVEPFDFDHPAVGFTTSRLPYVDAASVALHKALFRLKPVDEDYAYAPYAEAFNWDELRLDVEVEREWYIVGFRSTRAAGSTSVDLYEADRLAHEEAVTAGGLLAYWFGRPNERGSNLATCIWMSRGCAVAASSGEKHVKAMRLASSMYEVYDLERYVLRKVKGETGVSIQQWMGGEVKFAS